MSADVLNLAETKALVSPYEDIKSHVLSPSDKRVSLDAGRVLWEKALVEGAISQGRSAHTDFHLR